ncbi:class I adenylate-forming enzyme family protein [Chloroflexota bacterium]
MSTYERNLNIYEVLESVIKNNPQKEMLILGESRDNYRQFGDKVDALAAGLQQLGVEKGDRVGIILPTCVEVIYAYFATLKIGASFIPINPELRSFEIKHILSDSGAKAVITVGEMRGFDYISMLEQISAELPNYKITIVWGSDNRTEGTSLADLLKTEPQKDKSVLVEPDDIACIIYTSGTTGLPKGTIHSHKTKLNRLASLNAGTSDKGSPQTRLSPFPLFNAAGVDITIETILQGDKIVLMQSFDPVEALRIIEREQVTIIDSAPIMMKQMLSVKDFNRYNLSSLRLVKTGGSMSSPEMVQAVKDRLGCDYINTYAMTEASVVSQLSIEDPTDVQLSTVGRPVNGVDVKIVDNNRKELSINQAGEIAVRSPSLMLGYFNNQAKTQEVIDEEGFYYTGDIGSLDERGYLRILDRKKDMIIRGAQNIFPSEIENYLNTHPKIKMSAVIGVPSVVSGEKVRAYIQIEEGEEMTDIEVVKYCRGNIAVYKFPEEVRFVDSFPLNRMGKVQKKILREEYIEEG